MCTSYTPSTKDLLQQRFDVDGAGLADYPAHTFKDYLAPVIRLQDGQRRVDLAGFGFTPQRHIPPHIQPWDSMNARSETIASKRTFARAWNSGQLCLIPMLSFWEPYYESNRWLWDAGMGAGRLIDRREVGKSVRHRIAMANGEPFAVAGMWRNWREADGRTSLAFTMITLNADAHPLFRQMHKPDSPPDKRSVVIVPHEDWDSWLACKNPEIARTFFQLCPPEQLIHLPDTIGRRLPAEASNLDLFS